MEEKEIPNFKNEDFSTPYYKIFLFVGFVTLFVFLIFYLFTYLKNQEIKSIYNNFEQEGINSFSTIVDYHFVNQLNKRSHIYTYLLTDKNGKLHEINELVDEKTHLRLRVGNTIETKYILKNYFNRVEIYSRIIGNKQKIEGLGFLSNFSILGILFSILLILFGLAFFAFQK